MGHLYLYQPPFLIDRLYINSLELNTCPWYYMPSYLKTQYLLYTKQWFSIGSKLRKSWAGHYRVGHLYLYHPPFIIDRLCTNSLVFNACPLCYMPSYLKTQYLLFWKQWLSICSKLRKSWAGVYRMAHLYLYQPSVQIDRLYINSLYEYMSIVLHAIIPQDTVLLVYMYKDMIQYL